MTQPSSVVRFENVSLHFGETPALVDVSFEVAAGETRVVMGAAGSGKTTLLKTVVGLIKPDAGRVYLFDEDVTDRKESDMYEIRSKVGILFQEGALFDSLSVEENVSYPLLNQYALHQKGGRPETSGSRNGDSKASAPGDSSPAKNDGQSSQTPSSNPQSPDPRSAEPQSVEERVREFLRFVELEHTLEKFPSELSGGMRRRVGIARAIVTGPLLVLYDSPTAGLDPITANTIINLIIKQRDLSNTAAIMVTHRFLDGHLMANFRYNPNSGRVEAAARRVSESQAETSQVSTKFLVMKEGRLIFEGTEAELHASRDAYVLKFLKPGSS